MDTSNTQEEISEKSYTTSVVLVGIFGMFGIHHFYLGRIWHGIFDLSLSVVALYGIYSENFVFIGFILLLIDFIHSYIVIFQLLTGVYKDGAGKKIPYPGQKNNLEKKKS